MASLNKTAGLKKAPRKRGYPDSPAVMRKSNFADTTEQATLGDLFEDETIPNFAVSGISNSGMKIKIRAGTKTKPTKPPKPTYKQTTTTPFQLIHVRGNIAKCAANCGRALKDGPDELVKEKCDEDICIRHKEHDHFFLPAQNYWKDYFLQQTLLCAERLYCKKESFF